VGETGNTTNCTPNAVVSSLGKEDTFVNTSATKSHRDAIEGYIAALDSTRQRHVQTLIDIVREAAPDAELAIKWGMPCFTSGGLLCFVAGHKSHTTLGFYRGAELADPEGRLEGTGQGIRHTKIYSDDDIRPAQFRKWIEEAICLNQA